MSLIGNKVTEMEIRQYLTEQGFLGKAARLSDVELVAIGPPGWLQVYRFHAEVRKAEQPWQTFWGAIKDDERYGRDYGLFDTEADRNEQLTKWSAGLILRTRDRQHDALMLYLGLGLLVGLSVLGVVVAVISQISAGSSI